MDRPCITPVSLPTQDPVQPAVRTALAATCAHEVVQRGSWESLLIGAHKDEKRNTVVLPGILVWSKLGMTIRMFLKKAYQLHYFCVLLWCLF